MIFRQSSERVPPPVMVILLKLPPISARQCFAEKPTPSYTDRHSSPVPASALIPKKPEAASGFRKGARSPERKGWYSTPREPAGTFSMSLSISAKSTAFLSPALRILQARPVQSTLGVPD